MSDNEDNTVVDNTVVENTVVENTVVENTVVENTVVEKENKYHGDVPTIKLNYWNGRGLMEVPRMMLAYCKINKQAYHDFRYTTDEGNVNDNVKHYDDIKNNLTHNLGRLPTLVEEFDNSVGQSLAINFFLAVRCNLLGNTPLFSARIIELSEHLREMKSAYYNLVPYGTMPTDETNVKWFTEGADDYYGNAVMKNRNIRYMKWWSHRINNVLDDIYNNLKERGVEDDNIFACGNLLSLGDFLLYNTFYEHLTDDECDETLPKHKREPFGNMEMTNKVLEECPRIKKLCENIKNNENIKNYLETRGKQMF